MRVRFSFVVFVVCAARAATAPQLFVDRYCVACHNQKLRTAGLTMEELPAPGANAAADGSAETWEKILRKVRTGAMPPPSLPRPPDDLRRDFVSAVGDALDRDAALHPNPGRPAIHRLNRAEYANAVRDLVAITIDPSSLLPQDDSGYGFDNIADVLSVSPALLDRYLSAARRISERALRTPESRRKILICEPSARPGEGNCAKAILASLARQAYRRPVTNVDLKPLLTFYAARRRKSSFDAGIQAALRALLVSPDFLLRVENDPAETASGAIQRVSDLELASRLSFFLWSSIPDDELLEVAEHGRLGDSAVLEHQVRRMLQDPRSGALVKNFAGQWLDLRNLALVRPHSREFDHSLREAFQRETDLFIEDIIHEDRSVIDLLGANFTFLNERLARHYGIPGVQGDEFRKVELADGRRGGLLGQGGILTLTSFPTRTSVVMRGKWILENLLGEPPPPPPPDVPSLPQPDKSEKPVSLRRQMEQHRAQPMCAACHARMDPLGFALENYDAIGKWRDQEAGEPVDASARLPDGTEFTGPAGLKQALLDRREQFVETFTARLLTYALGRGLESYDQPSVRAIDRDAARQQFCFSSIVLGIVKSAPFQMRSSL
jgi:cytochrome c551/c552